MDNDDQQPPPAKNNNLRREGSAVAGQNSEENVGESVATANDLSSTTPLSYPPTTHSDDDFEYANYDSDLELDSRDGGPSANDGTNNQSSMIPLVPTEFTSILEAQQNFSAVFDSRYGAQHAPFYEGSLQDAIVDAFEAPGRGIEERRPLAIYLHNDNAVAAHIFAQSVMCSVDVSNLLKCQFVVWAWDVTQYQNRQSFYEWIAVSNMSSLADSIKLISQPKYPLLVLVVKERGVVIRSGAVYGQDTAGAALQKLMAALDHYQMIKQQDSEEERNRIEREQFRQEQVEEYQRGLAADRAKQEELKRKREREQEEKKKQIQDEKAKQKHRNALAQCLPSEPDPADPEAITIRLRLPNGDHKTRMFRTSESVEMLLIYAQTLGYDTEQYRFWTSDRPRKEVSQMDTSKTFTELGWPKREVLTLEEM